MVQGNKHGHHGRTIGAPDNRHSRSFRLIRKPPCTGRITANIHHFQLPLTSRLKVCNYIQPLESFGPTLVNQIETWIVHLTNNNAEATSVRKLLTAIAFRYLAGAHSNCNVSLPLTKYELHNTTPVR